MIAVTVVRYTTSSYASSMRSIGTTVVASAFASYCPAVEHRDESRDVAHRAGPAGLAGVMGAAADREQHGGQRDVARAAGSS